MSATAAWRMIFLPMGHGFPNTSSLLVGSRIREGGNPHASTPIDGLQKTKQGKSNKSQEDERCNEWQRLRPGGSVCV
ncbi:hypothetical protein QBC45DRAFT_407811 [Copromyces sp. CBS 386.78]|nr:hypothetical protein QBC45DRAFT_407811 [Copromyces sp. CBS 386.78]